jgi:hypothetical protein
MISDDFDFSASYYVGGDNSVMRMQLKSKLPLVAQKAHGDQLRNMDSKHQQLNKCRFHYHSTSITTTSNTSKRVMSLADLEND